MKKKLIFLVVATLVSMLGGLAGCDGAPLPTATVSAAPPAASIKVVETIGVTDKPPTPAPALLSAEKISVNDSVSTLLSLMVKVTEIINVKDLPAVILPAVIIVQEIVRVADTAAVEPQLTLPVITVFTASPALISRGGSATLSWQVTGAVTVKLYPDIGTVRSTGTMSVSPTSTRTYTLEATNDSGTVTATVTVTVTVTRG
jgi:hypothetical protein